MRSQARLTGSQRPETINSTSAVELCLLDLPTEIHRDVQDERDEREDIPDSGQRLFLHIQDASNPGPLPAQHEDGPAQNTGQNEEPDPNRREIGCDEADPVAVRVQTSKLKSYIRVI